MSVAIHLNGRWETAWLQRRGNWWFVSDSELQANILKHSSHNHVYTEESHAVARRPRNTTVHRAHIRRRTDNTRSRNRRHKSTPLLWRQFLVRCHSNLGPDSSGTRFWDRLEHCSIPSQKVACKRLKWSFMIYSFSTYLWLQYPL